LKFGTKDSEDEDMSEPRTRKNKENAKVDKTQHLSHIQKIWHNEVKKKRMQK